MPSFLIFIILISLSFTDSTTTIVEIKNKYIGGWPSHSLDEVLGHEMQINCPNDIGCECTENSDCINNNCQKLPKGKYCLPKNGDFFPYFKATDQYGDIVDIYDFSKQGKYILLEMGTTWCPPCQLLASWFSFNDQEIANKRFWNHDYQHIYDLVKNDQIYYITVLYENDNKDNVDYETLYDWFSMYPEDKIPVLADSDKFLHRWIKPTGLPAIMLLDQNMQIVTYSSRGIKDAFESVLNIYGNVDEK